MTLFIFYFPFFSSIKVSIDPEVTSQKINRQIISQLINLYRLTNLGERIPAYDGMKSIYTAGPLPFESKEFIITLPDSDPRPSSSASPGYLMLLTRVFLEYC